MSKRAIASFHVYYSCSQPKIPNGFYRETGKVAPKVRRQQTPTKLKSEGLNLLQEIIEKNNDATLEEIRHLLASKTEVLIGISTLHRMLGNLNLTQKKNKTRNGKRNR